MLKKIPRDSLIFFGGALVLFLVIQILISMGVLSRFWSTLLVKGSIMAMVSPYIIGITACWGQRSWFTAGMVLFISTVGSFAGTNITAFFLISLFPISRIIVGLGIICLAVSLLVLALGADRRIADSTDR